MGRATTVDGQLQNTVSVRVRTSCVRIFKRANTVDGSCYQHQQDPGQAHSIRSTTLHGTLTSRSMSLRDRLRDTPSRSVTDSETLRDTPRHFTQTPSPNFLHERIDGNLRQPWYYRASMLQSQVNDTLPSPVFNADSDYASGGGRIEDVVLIVCGSD